jgi:hypothetical protein
MKRELSPHFIEQKIRERLSRRFKTALEKRKLEIKDGVEAEFDLVSRKERVVGMIKSNRPRRKGKRKGQIRKQTQFGGFSSDCLLLATRKNSKMRLFVLTNGKMYDEFRKSPQAKAAESFGIRILKELL